MLPAPPCGRRRGDAVEVVRPDIPELVRIINLAYRVEDFFIDGDRTNEADVRSRLETPGACFIVVDSDKSTVWQAPSLSMSTTAAGISLSFRWILRCREGDSRGFYSMPSGNTVVARDAMHSISKS
ncbi:MAG TPA: hypothetical protein VM053_05695 [Gemmatimonadaceae bacterium]|nr:hypothetical protein [Gemmatimonadaceae bacterium]